MLLQNRYESLAGVGWGAMPDPSGGVVFRLWAPDAERVSVLMNSVAHPMFRAEDGWHQVHIPECGPGQTYQFQLGDGLVIADPASRAQVEDVHGPSVVVDHSSYQWMHESFPGRPFEETIISEIHIGTFTPEGTFLAAIPKLPLLKEAGITAIEILPVAHFPGQRGWGYDGVLHYAPHSAYGSPDDLKALVDAAHGLGMMVFIDVVYNHFGPEGNYLHHYAEGFFRSGPPTPWGAAVAFELPAVRQYFIDNAMMWIGDYRFDGIRFDATEQIQDESEDHFLREITRHLRHTFVDRHLHLIAEDQTARRAYLKRNGKNQPETFTAAWNDSLHHCLHVLVTGEAKGHYQPFEAQLWENIRKSTASGFLLPHAEGDVSVPADAYVNYLQNHDQIGNRAFGERLATLIPEKHLDVLTAMLFLIPQTPMLFMGEEYGETNPFCFFADYTGELADGMRKGRVGEAENFGGMPEGKTLQDLPDPMSPATFDMSRLDWSKVETEAGAVRRRFIRRLADIRQIHIGPLLKTGAAVEGKAHELDDGLLAVDWEFPGGTLYLRMNFQDRPARLPDVQGTILYASDHEERAEGSVTDALSGPGIVVALNRKG